MMECEWGTGPWTCVCELLRDTVWEVRRSGLLRCAADWFCVQLLILQVTAFQGFWTCTTVTSGLTPHLQCPYVGFARQFFGL
jgi:hypothetical protein